MASVLDILKIVADGAKNEPQEGVVHAIDGNRIDVLIRSTSRIIRNVDVVGSISSVVTGQTVTLKWVNGEPVAYLVGSSGAATLNVSVDGNTLEHSTHGMRVKNGGIRPWHLSFNPSMEGHTHLDILQKAGWTIDLDGAISKDDLYLHSDGQISLGQHPNILKLDAKNSTHRIWVGSVDPLMADFSVSKEGKMVSRSGQIAGWDILSDRLSKNNIELLQSGEIRVGEDNDIGVFSSANLDGWRFWIGNSNPELAPFRVKKDGQVWMDSVTIATNTQSANYVPDLYGWRIDQSGWAEFNDVKIRGEIKSAVFSKENISVVAGRQIVTEGTSLVSGIGNSDEIIVVSYPSFAEGEILQISIGSRNEWMRTLGEAVEVEGGDSYEVERGVGGESYEFYAGETIFSRGGSSFPEEPNTFSDPQTTWGSSIFGSGNYSTYGGFLTLDGSKDYGPYVGAAIRYGANYQQISDVFRIGKLTSFLGGIFGADFGFAVGDEGRYFSYTQSSGLKIQSSTSRTSIDDRGLLAGKFFIQNNSDANFLDGHTGLYVDEDKKELRAKYKQNSVETDVLVANLAIGAFQFNFRGAWQMMTEYKVNDVVSINGQGYICIQAHTSLYQSEINTYWVLGVLKGEKGDKGEQGIQGPVGGVTIHSGLTGLYNDDHKQYHTSERAATWHSTLLGQHVSNGNSHDHSAGDGNKIKESGISISDNLDWNASIGRHGFMPKLPQDGEGKYLDGTGQYTAPILSVENAPPALLIYLYRSFT